MSKDPATISVRVGTGQFSRAVRKVKRKLWWFRVRQAFIRRITR